MPDLSAPAALWWLTLVLRAHPEYLAAYLGVVGAAMVAGGLLLRWWPHQALPGGEPADEPAVQLPTRRRRRPRRLPAVHAQQYTPGVASVDAEATVALTDEARRVVR